MSAIQSAWNGLVRTGFRLLYEDLSWTYDMVSYAVSLGHWSSWRRCCLPFLYGPRVLELGFGPGHLQVELAERGFQPTGLDLSAHMARTATHRLQKAGRAKGIVCGSAQQLPFPDRHFNSVVATFPTPYIAEAATVSEVRRVLAANGRFVIVPEAQLIGTGPVRRLIETAYRLTGQRTSDGADDVVRWSDILCGQLRAAGFACAIEEAILPGSRVAVVVAWLGPGQVGRD